MKNKNTDCLFCKIASRVIKSDFVYESDNFFAFLDIHPKKPGHTLIIPKKHFENFIDFPTVFADELFLTIKNVASIRLKEGYEGFNLITNNGSVAGQVVNHLHFHLIPRKKDDGGIFSKE